MSELESERWQIFIDQYPQVMKLQSRLAKEDWYRNDGWTLFVGPYHAGIYFQMFKPNWHNYTLDGIHIEAGISVEALRDKRLLLELHVGHRNLFDREKFNALTIPKMTPLVSSWNGQYTYSPVNLSARLSTEVPFTKTGFADQIAKELTRWSALGPIIDEGLANL